MSFTHPDDLHAAFAAAFQTGDIAALVDLYEDSAIQLQQDGTVTSPDDLTGVIDMPPPGTSAIKVWESWTRNDRRRLGSRGKE